MGCCLIGAIGAIWPRLALLFLYFFTTIPQQVFRHWLYPVLGFLFLPTTTLAYALCLHFIGPMEDIWSLLIVFLALLHDLGQLGIIHEPIRNRKI